MPVIVADFDQKLSTREDKVIPHRTGLKRAAEVRRFEEGKHLPSAKGPVLPSTAHSKHPVCMLVGTGKAEISSEVLGVAAGRGRERENSVRIKYRHAGGRRCEDGGLHWRH